MSTSVNLESPAKELRRDIESLFECEQRAGKIERRWRVKFLTHATCFDDHRPSLEFQPVTSRMITESGECGCVST